MSCLCSESAANIEIAWRAWFRDAVHLSRVTLEQDGPADENAFGGIRCPLCAWRPSASSRWWCESTGTPEPSFAAAAPPGTPFRRAAGVPGALISGDGRRASDAPDGACTRIGTKEKHRGSRTTTARGRERLSESRNMMGQLSDAIALVTGASRGAGRAIALELGAAGATVYVTGRSVDGGPTTDNVPGTIDETAREVSGRGGRGIAVRCDHTVDADVESCSHGSAPITGGSICSSTTCGADTRTASAVRSRWCRSGSNRSISGTACSLPACVRISRPAASPSR